MNRRALVVEDDADTRSSLVAMLECDGCIVDSAPDGEAAVRLLSREEYSVVLLDLGLPRVDGNDVMEHIACTHPETLLRTIVVTGSDTRGVRAMFPELCDALAKPIVTSDLMSAVRRCEKGVPLVPRRGTHRGQVRSRSRVSET